MPMDCQVQSPTFGSQIGGHFLGVPMACMVPHSELGRVVGILFDNGYLVPEFIQGRILPCYHPGSRDGITAVPIDQSIVLVEAVFHLRASYADCHDKRPSWLT